MIKLHTARYEHRDEMRMKERYISKGDPIWFAPQFVATVSSRRVTYEEDGVGTEVYMAGNPDDCYYVYESPEEVVELIEESLQRMKQ